MPELPSTDWSDYIRFVLLDWTFFYQLVSTILAYAGYNFTYARWQLIQCHQFSENLINFRAVDEFFSTVQQV